MSAATRIRIAWAMLLVSIIGLPVSLVLSDEPPIIMTLSWAALIWTSVDTIFTASTRK